MEELFPFEDVALGEMSFGTPVQPAPPLAKNDPLSNSQMEDFMDDALVGFQKAYSLVMSPSG
jgi:hypothetical protein